MKKIEHFKITCKNCSKDNFFDQPYANHAGFAEQGFLYSDSGVYTLVWSWYNPVVQKILPHDWKTTPKFNKNLSNN